MFHWIEDITSAVYSDIVHAMRTCVIVIRDGTVNLYAPTTSTPLLDTVTIGYGSHIEVSYNSTLDSATISLPINVLADSNEPISHASHHSLVIEQLSPPDSRYHKAVVPHPDYPTSEPLRSSRTDSFRRRFDVPFIGTNGGCYARPFIPLELVVCYSIDTSFLCNPILWLSVDYVLDYLLSGFLPARLASAAVGVNICPVGRK